MDTRTQQLRLVLWKDLLVRRKQLALLLAIVAWVVAVFLILYIVRATIQPHNNPTCQYKARALPSAGIFNFMQSFICNIDNKCEDLEEFEEIPQYKNAIMTDVANVIEPIYKKENFKSLVDNIPGMSQLLRGLIKVIDKPNGSGDISIGSQLFKNPEILKEKIKKENLLTDDAVDILFGSSLRVENVLESLESVNEESTICDPQELQKILILKNPTHINEISAALCNLDNSKIPELIETMAMHLELGDLLKIINEISKVITEYSFYDDLPKVVEMILQMKSVQQTVPRELNIIEWLPKLFPLLHNATDEGITQDLSEQLLDIVEPFFNNTSNWIEIKSTYVDLMGVAILTQNAVLDLIDNVNASDTDFGKLASEYKDKYLRDYNPNVLLSSANDTVRLIYAFYADETDYFTKMTHLLDNLVFLRNRRTQLTGFLYIFKLANEVFSILEDISFYSHSMEQVFYNASIRHKEAVQNILSMGPQFLTDFTDCLYNSSCTMMMVEQPTTRDLFCTQEVTEQIYPNVPSEKVIETLCKNETVAFFDDLQQQFKIHNRSYDTQSLVYTFQEPKENNLLQATQALKDFISNIRNARTKPNIDWSTFNVDNKAFGPIWTKINRNKKNYLINVKFCLLRNILENISNGEALSVYNNFIQAFLFELELIPTPLSKYMQRNFYEIVNSIAKTFTENFPELSAIPLRDWPLFFCDTTKTTDKQEKHVKTTSCLLLTYVTNRLESFWSNSPYVAKMATTIRRHFLEWNGVTLNTQIFFEEMEEFFEHDLQDHNKLEVFQPKFWSEWSKNVDATSAVQMTFQILKSLIENTLQKYHNEEESASLRVNLENSLNSNYILLLINKIVDVNMVLKNTNGSSYPITYHMSLIVYNNLDNIKTDLNDANILGSVTSLGNVNTNDSSADKPWIRALKGFVWNEELQREWRAEFFNGTDYYYDVDYKISANKINGVTNRLRKFLFDLRNERGEKQLVGADTVEMDVTKKILDIQKIFCEDLVKASDVSKNTSNSTLEELWYAYLKNNNCNYYRCNDFYKVRKYTAYFIMNSIDQLVQSVSQYVENVYGKDSVEPWIILGFGTESKVSKFMEKLPQYLELFIYNYRSTAFENNINTLKSTQSYISCNNVINFLEAPDFLQLSNSDIQYLHSLCKDVILEDNIFFKAGFKIQNMFSRDSLNDLTLKTPEVVTDVVNLRKSVDLISKSKSVRISANWSKKWTGRMNATMERLSELNFTSKNTIARFLHYIPALNHAIPAISAVGNSAGIILAHISENLKRFKKKQLAFSDFTSNTELRKLLEINDKYPLQVAEIYLDIINQYLELNNRSFDTQIQNYCAVVKYANETDFRADLKHVADKFCEIKFSEIQDGIISEENLREATNENFNVEQTLEDLIRICVHLMNLSPDVQFQVPFESFYTTGKALTTEKRWEESLILARYFYNIKAAYSYNMVVMSSTVLLQSLRGGDFWSRIKQLDSLELRTLFRVLEKIPFLGVQLPELILSEKVLYTVLYKIQSGVHYCDIDFQDQHIDNDNLIFIIQDITCAIFTRPHGNLLDRSHGEVKVNVTYLAKNIFDATTALIELNEKGSSPAILPDWLNKNVIHEKYKNLSLKHNDTMFLRLLTNTVDDVLKLIRNTNLELVIHEWNSPAPAFLAELNKQIPLASKYVQFVCDIPKLETSQMQERLLSDLEWKSIGKFNVSNLNFIEQLQELIKVTRAEILKFDTNETLTQQSRTCVKNLFAMEQARNITTYLKMGKLFVNLMKNSSEINILSELRRIPLLNDYFGKIREELVLLEPTSQVLDVKMGSGIRPSKININQLVKIKDANDTVKYFKEYKWFGRLFYFDNQTQKDEVFYDLTSNATEIAEAFFESINETDLNFQLEKKRIDTFESLDWMQSIIDKLQNIFRNSEGILKFISENDFSSISNESEKFSDLAEGILDIIEKKSIEKVFVTLKTLLNDLRPLLQNEEVTEDLFELVTKIKSLDVFKYLGLLRTKYPVSKLFPESTEIQKYLMENMNFTEKITHDLQTSSLDIFNILSAHIHMLHSRTVVCEPDFLSHYLNFHGAEKTAVFNTTKSLCSMDLDGADKLISLASKQLNIVHVFDYMMNTSVNNILAESSMTKDEADKILRNIRDSFDILLPVIKLVAKMSTEVTKFTENNPNGRNTTINRFPASEFLPIASQLLCGRKSTKQNSKLYAELFDVKDFNKNFDVQEQKSLATPFCQSVYKNIVRMKGGKIIWSFIKPLIRGKILYTPNLPYVQNIIRKVNASFESIQELNDVLYKISDGILSMKTVENLTDSLTKIEKFIDSAVGKIVIDVFMKNTSLSHRLRDINVGTIVQNFKYAKVIETVQNAKDMLECISLDRFVAVESEDELEHESKKYMDTNEFIAGIVFSGYNRVKRSAEDMPNNITYIIRMDVDSVPSTSLLKYKFWTPDPEDDFMENLRYFRGFIELQDLIDHTIIDLQSSGSVKWKSYTQQMPNPCYKDDFFQTILNISQLLQVGFFFGLIMTVATSVRFLVMDKESGNTMIMNVMGLRYSTHYVSWFILSYATMILTMTIIFLILKVGGVLTLTNGFVFFVYLMLYGFSVVMFCYMLSCIVNSASVAAVGSIIFYLLTYMPYIIIIAVETTMPAWIQVLVNFSMSTSFCYGCLYVLRYEIQGVGLQWSNMWYSPLVDDNMNFGVTCVFLVIDGLIYGFIGYVFSRLSQDVRTVLRKVFSRCFGFGKHLNVQQSSYLTFDCELFNFIGESHFDDVVSNEGARSDDNLKIGITIKNLTKTYKVCGKTVAAIENINMTLYAGQITTLLGHNGAGKTTLIKILSGMMKATSGHVIINNEITNYNKTKQYLGVCPQSSILLQNLSPLEHLQFYAQLKTGKNNSEVTEDVLQMLDNLGLESLANEPVSHLSEGNQRRLCVAIAFIGRPSLVVLDEPSSGVDPVARRQIWDLIVRLKEGRTVLMTTHHLDEAELLSDRVVILHKGKTLCSGSPVTLKHTYGHGYKLAVTFPSTDETNANNVLDVVKSIAQNATISSIQSGTVHVSVPFLAPLGAPNDFEGITSALESSQDVLGHETFSINCTTLEEVYLELCAQEDGLETADKTDNSSSIDNSETPTQKSVNESCPEEQVLMNEDIYNGQWTKKLLALLLKRAIHYVQDWRIIMTAFVLPMIFVVIAMGFCLIRPPNLDEPALKLSSQLYNENTADFISVKENNSNAYIHDLMQRISKTVNKDMVPYNVSSRECSCKDGLQHCMKPSEIIYDHVLHLNSITDTVNWIVETHDEYVERRYGGWSQANEDGAFAVWYNAKGYHALPSYLNTMNNAVLRTVNPSASITTYSHPLKLSAEKITKNSISQHVADVGISLVLLIAFCLMPASAAIYLVQERTNEEKRIQLLSGVTPTLYWVAAWIWDTIVLLFALLLAVIVLKVFNLPVYVSRENLDAVCLLVFLYGWASVPTVHLLEKLFRDASMANMLIFCTFMFVGVTELTSLLLIDVLSTSEFAASVRAALHGIYLIFPQYVLGDGLIEISKNNIRSELLKRFHMDTYISPIGWDLLGLHYLSLFIVGTVLFCVNIALENKWSMPRDKPSNVSLEMYALETVKLTKTYRVLSGLRTAVNNLNIQVPFGECLGLIGVNGAGKSTTFKMLTTELSPTSGEIFVQGRDVTSKPFCTGEMGYCPQNNALDPKLTVRQTLQVYAVLRGIQNRHEIVSKLMYKFELQGYSDRNTEKLSGGNKRKLCTAISVMGRSPLVLMDEPTSGMDPYSRSLVANAVNELTRQNRSVMLTSHSVEDCETLCSTVAVMINGRVVCKGSPQELKERYGSGYNLTVRLSKCTDQKDLSGLMSKFFPACQLQSVQYCTSQFIVNPEKVSDIFRNVKSISKAIQIEEYNVVQSSLDQVFVNLASNNKMFDEQNYDAPNMYSMNIL